MGPASIITPKNNGLTKKEFLKKKLTKYFWKKMKKNTNGTQGR